MNLDVKPQNGARCTAVFAEYPARVVWKFDDGSEVETDHDLSTRRGQMLVAQEASKLGLGDVATLAQRLSAPIGPGFGPILQRPLG
jgi:hypothetical protein